MVDEWSENYTNIAIDLMFGYDICAYKCLSHWTGGDPFQCSESAMLGGIMKKLAWIAFILLLIPGTTIVAKKKKKDKKEEPKVEKKDDILAAGTFGAFKPRNIGPALTEGRITDLVVHPEHDATWYITIAAGGVWKTENAGTTWKPLFDGQASYSIGCITIDPNNPQTIWVGSGENNSQRSVGYGDGVYRSLDGGKSWKNMGLKESEHIAKIMVDPRNSDVVFVASQGPLWSAGGDRGLYKTVDGGENWEKVLEISEHTGVTDLVYDPRNPDILYAASYQRRRHVWTLINGGPESTIYKSTDNGKNWRKIKKGLPGGDLGRIGLAIAPSNPDILYAIVEGTAGKSGFYRSSNLGESWSKQSGYVSRSPQYYQEIIVDPHDEDVIYSNDTLLHRSEDGGKNFSPVGERHKHVDNHVTWIDPGRTDHLLVGSDGGLYETFDRGKTWLFRANLPITQFYKITVDNDTPYNVYGGTQDNFSLGGPSQTHNEHGIRNSDWFVTHGGDGFQSRVDPEDPNTVYSESQHGGLGRYNRITGEQVGIQPQPEAGQPALKWNWDAPLIISPHNSKRLYFAANILFRSDDRGDSWKAVSPDLSRGIDRNKLKVMDRVWGVDSVSKNRSTSIYGNIVALSESPVKEGLIVVGTDDGLIQITEDGGQNWRKIDAIPGVPEMTYVNRLEMSRYNENVIYAAFNNHKMGDFKPYLLRSDDLGKTWTSIVSDLPERGSVYCLAEDHVNKDLLFAGTEFGAFFTIDGGKKWIKFSGIPTIAVRDLAIQERENDLVFGTFGRGFYILDDYSPLRMVSTESLEKEAMSFPVKDPLLFIPSSPMGGRGKAYQGDNPFLGENPEYGAIFTYYLAEAPSTLKKDRAKKEGKIRKEGGDVFYPTWDELRQEERQEKPAVILTVTDEAGAVVRRLESSASKGFHRVAWDLSHPSSMPARLTSPRGRSRSGPLVTPGVYKVSFALSENGKLSPFGETRSFTVKLPHNAVVSESDNQQRLAHQKRFMGLMRAMMGASNVMNDADKRIQLLKKALLDTPSASSSHLDTVLDLQNRLKDLEVVYGGDDTITSRFEVAPPGLSSRLMRAIYEQSGSTSPPTKTHLKAYDIVAAEFEVFLADLKTLVTVDLKKLEDEMEAAAAPWTPGRFPKWSKE